MGAAGAAAGTSIAGAGIGAYAQVFGQGTAAGMSYKASALESAAQRGRVAAAQTGASASERLAADLGRIDAVRAAAHVDPASPTGAAIRDLHESLGLTQKSIAVDQIMAQSQQEASDAAYLRSASKYALLGGSARCRSKPVRRDRSGPDSLGKPASVVPAGYDPNKLSSLY